MVDQLPNPATHAAMRLEFETLIADLSSRFINLAPVEVDREIEDALGRVCQALELDYGTLWQWSAATPDVIVPTHIYCALPGVPPAGAPSPNAHR